MQYWSRRALMVPVVVMLLVAGAATTNFGGPTLGRTQKIKKWGYSIKAIKGWNAIPPQPGERFVVGRWKPDLSKAMKRGDYQSYSSGQFCELRVIRIPLVGATTVGTPEEEAAKRKKEKEEEKMRAKYPFGDKYRKRLNPKSLDEYIEGQWEGASKRYIKKSFKAGKVSGHLVEFTSGSRAICIGMFNHDYAGWAVVYTAFEETYRKDWQKICKRSIKSLKFFAPAGGGRVPPKAVADTTKLKGDAKRKAIKAGIAGSPGWYAVDTKNYVFLSNSKQKGFIKSLSRQVETIRKKVYEKLFPPQKKIDAISIVRVLDTQNEYHQYGGPGGSAGYWNSAKEELVLFTKFDGVTKKNSKAYCRSVMYHEAFHQYIHYAVGDLAPHSWFNEGHGDYFAGMVVAGSKVSVGKFDWRVRFLKKHMAEKRDLIPIRSLVRLPQGEYYSNAGLKYSQGWALIYWLRKVTRTRRYRDIPNIYFDYLSRNIAAFRKEKKESKDDNDPFGGGTIPGIPGIKIVSYKDSKKVDQILSEAVDEAFRGVDIEKIDKKFRRWVETL